MAQPTPEMLAKLPKWARDAFRDLHRDNDRLNEALSDLRQEVSAQRPNSPGHVLISGYSSEPVPLGPYFHLICTQGDSAGVAISMQDGGLYASVLDGYIAALPVVSNGLKLRYLPREPTAHD